MQEIPYQAIGATFDLILDKDLDKRPPIQIKTKEGKFLKNCVLMLIRGNREKQKVSSAVMLIVSDESGEVSCATWTEKKDSKLLKTVEGWLTSFKQYPAYRVDAIFVGTFKI
jgi:hypothetical protein